VLKFLASRPHVLEIVKRQQDDPAAAPAGDRIEALRRATLLVACYSRKPTDDDLSGLSNEEPPGAEGDHPVDRIVVPLVEWRKTPLADVVRELDALARRHDPAGKGVRIGLHAENAKDLRVTLRGKQLSIGDLAVVVAETVGLRVTVLDEELVFLDPP
jgi:hypothetical protein